MNSSSDETWPKVFRPKILMLQKKMRVFVRVVWGSCESQRERERERVCVRVRESERVRERERDI